MFLRVQEHTWPSLPLNHATEEAKKEKAALQRFPVGRPAGGGRGEETGEKEKREPVVMLLRFNKQPIKHLSTAGEQRRRDGAEEKKRGGIKHIEGEGDRMKDEAAGEERQRGCVMTTKSRMIKE